MPLEDLQKDGNSAIARASQEIADQCAAQLIAKLQLKPYVAPTQPVENAVTPATSSAPTTQVPAAPDEASSASATAAPAAQDVAEKPIAENSSDSATKVIDASQDKAVTK